MIVEEAQNHYPDLKALFMSGDTGLRMFRQGQLLAMSLSLMKFSGQASLVGEAMLPS